jgi:hypothetical protein
MRPEKISNLKTGDRIELQNEPFLNNLLVANAIELLKKKIDNGDLIGVDSLYDTSYLYGVIDVLPNGTVVELDLVPGELFKFDMNSGYLVELLEPGDDGYRKTTPPPFQGKATQAAAQNLAKAVNNYGLNIRPFDRAIDGVGTRVAVNSRNVFNWYGDDTLLFGRVERLDYDTDSKVNFDLHDTVYVREKYYIVFDSDEDAKKVRTFDSKIDGVGSRVAVSGSSMPAGNDVTKMYYGTIKRVSDFANPNFFIGIEFDSKIVSGNSLGGLADNDSGLEVINTEVFILDEPITIKVSSSVVLQMITDLILSTTSRTTTNRAELIKALIEDKVTEDEVRQSFDSQEAYDLFMDILQDLEKDEAKRLGTTVSTTTTPTPTPVAKRGRKKKEPLVAQPVEIITPDISDFTDEDELSSLLDEFLT